MAKDKNISKKRIPTEDKSNLHANAKKYLSVTHVPSDVSVFEENPDNGQVQFNTCKERYVQ